MGKAITLIRSLKIVDGLIEVEFSKLTNFDAGTGRYDVENATKQITSAQFGSSFAETIES